MTAACAHEGFRHEIMFYAGVDDFVERVGEYVRDGLAGGEAVLVVVAREKIDRLRAHLGTQAGDVAFRDMAEVGRNPAWIIPLWRDFVREQEERGVGFRGVGEPIHVQREPHELIECQRHEALLNVAFAGEPSWSLLCPYDTLSLDAAVVDEALRSHPYRLDGVRLANDHYQGLERCGSPLRAPLDPPPPDVLTLEFGRHDLRALRRAVAQHAAALGLDLRRAHDLLLAVHELAVNSVRHAGGGGTLRVWQDSTRIVVEVRDAGRIEEPLAGRVRPSQSTASGRGLWLVHQLCDLVEIRACEDFGAVRAHLVVS